MSVFFVFTDGSVNTTTKVGVGACLVLDSLSTPIAQLEKNIHTIRFENTSSTVLELQTVLWVLENIHSASPFEHSGGSASEILKHKITLYTDSQNIVRLPGRRERLETRNYYNVKQKKLKNWALYKKFYGYLDCCDIDIVKVEGHMPALQRNSIDEIFSLVDNAARTGL